MTRFYNCTLIFAQHAQAASGSDDKTRILTVGGRRQAIALMLRLGGLKYDFIVISPTNKTRQTAGVLAGDIDSTKIIEVESMYETLVPADHRDLLGMFGDLGYGRPLADYFGHQHNGPLRRLSEECAFNIHQELGDAITGKTLLFVGHPVLLSGMIYNMFDEGAIKTLALTHVLGECGAIRVDTDGQGEAVAEVVAQGRVETVTAVVH